MPGLMKAGESGGPDQGGGQERPGPPAFQREGGRHFPCIYVGPAGFELNQSRKRDGAKASLMSKRAKIASLIVVAFLALGIVSGNRFPRIRPRRTSGPLGGCRPHPRRTYRSGSVDDLVCRYFAATSCAADRAATAQQLGAP